MVSGVGDFSNKVNTVPFVVIFEGKQKNLGFPDLKIVFILIGEATFLHSFIHLLFAREAVKCCEWLNYRLWNSTT